MNAVTLDPQRLRQLFDLRSAHSSGSGGSYREDPYPTWHRLREQGPVHEGTVHQLTGVDDDFVFHGLPFPDLPHYSAFSYEACNEAFRNPRLFASSPRAVDLEFEGRAPEVTNSMLTMNGAQHRRYRGLVQPWFLPARANWWMENWIQQTVSLLIDGFADAGRAELNVEFCAAIPLLTITGSFGIPLEQALDVRAALRRDPGAVVAMVEPIVAARRRVPQDDLISELVQSELTDEDGVTHRLSDNEIYSFSLLLLAAGSGTTWKQMGTTLTALLQRPELMAAVRDDRALLRPAIEESLRWMPTDPMFPRWVTEDTEFYGVTLPAGSILHLCIGAANRDPARWEHPDEFDFMRPIKSSLAFGGGVHICLGMHVARAEMITAIGMLLDRLPNLRLDPDAEPPGFVGMYERGPTAIPVLFDAGRTHDA